LEIAKLGDDLPEGPFLCVNLLISERDARARIGDVGGQFQMVLQGNAPRLTHYLELTIDS
jgi:hypothetical protein